jgi:hypothetical protein
MKTERRRHTSELVTKNDSLSPQELLQGVHTVRKVEKRKTRPKKAKHKGSESLDELSEDFMSSPQPKIKSKKLGR